MMGFIGFLYVYSGFLYIYIDVLFLHIGLVWVSEPIITIPQFWGETVFASQGSSPAK